MINKSIIAAILKSATQERKDKVINEFLNHLSATYDYNDTRASHILEMLCGEHIINIGDVSEYYIENHLELLTYNHEELNIKNIKIAGVDNIDCVVKVEYEYLEKINEDRGDVSYTPTYALINFIDNPDILSK